MTTSTWLREATVRLESAGIGTARLDALVLLEDVTGKDRAWLLAHPEFQIPATQIGKLKNLLNRRASHEPLAYIRGKTEFYGREFLLTPAVLEPRPESETMIDLLKDFVIPAFEQERATAQSQSGKAKGSAESPLGENNKVGIRIADVGTGSGALGITAQLELPNTLVDLLDIDSEALKVTKKNVDKFTLNISVLQTDLLEKSSGDYDILLCNLPYVPDDFQINPAAQREPRIAIFGGSDGLDLYRKLFDQIKNLSKKPLYILTEALPPQHEVLQGVATDAGYDLSRSADFIQAYHFA